MFLWKTSFFTEIREVVRHEDLAIFDHLIYQRGSLLDKLLRRGSDVDYLFPHHNQNISHGINHSVISNDHNYSSPCSEGKSIVKSKFISTSYKRFKLIEYCYNEKRTNI